MVKYHRVADRPEAQRAVEAMMRALQKPEKRAYAQRAVDSYHDVVAVTRAGIYLGKQPAYHVDAPRIAKTAERYVRGLHFLERGARVPDDHEIRVLVNVESIINAQSRIASAFAASTLRVVGERIFHYRWAAPSDRPTASAWLLVFFDSFPLFALIHPPHDGNLAQAV